MKRVIKLGLHYWPVLLASVFFMALVGLCQAAMALLIKPLFDRVLNPTLAKSPILIATIPFINKPIYLDWFVPPQIEQVWTMVAFAILAVFAIKGISDYIGNYLVSYVGFRSVTDLRQRVFEHVLRQDASFFEVNSTGRLMSSIMNEIGRAHV